MIVRDSGDGRVRARLSMPTNHIGDIGWRPDGRALAAASRLHRLHLWSRGEGDDWGASRVVALHEVPLHARFHSPLAWSPDGEFVAVGSDRGVVSIVDATSAEVVHEFAAHPVTVTSLAWNSTGTRLASSSNDGTMAIWRTSRVESVEELLRLPLRSPPVEGLSWSRADTRISAIAWTHDVFVWEVGAVTPAE